MSVISNLKKLSESPFGVRRWKCSAELTSAVLEFLGGDLDKVRRGAIDKRGRLRFSSGGGYDFVSADLLGGSADGRAAREFSAWCEERGYDF